MVIHMSKKPITLTSDEQFVVIKRLFGYIKLLKSVLIVGVVLAVSSTVFKLLGPLIMRQIIDTQFIKDVIDFDAIIFLMVLYTGSSLLATVLRYFQTVSFSKIGYRVTEDLRNDLFTKLQALGMRYFDQTPAGSIVSRVTNDTDAIQDMFNNILSVIFTSIVSMVGIVIAMLYLDVRVTLICLVFIPITLFIMHEYQKRSTKVYEVSQEKISQLNTKLSESISGMGIIQKFAQEHRLSKEFDHINDDYYTARLRTVRLDGLLLSPIINLLTALALAAVFGFLGFESLSSPISTGALVAFIEYIYSFFDPVMQIMDRLAIFQQAVVSAYRVFLVLDDEELAPHQNNIEGLTVKEGSIEFKDVSFSYDGKNKVLNNISFVVNPGETVALVGHTGSGKSSIINIMMRFYEFYEGEVLVDGRSIKDFPIEELRKSTGLVLQEPFLYYGTINDNVRLLNESITDEQIVEACKFVQADTFIDQLPDKYNHQVIERGASFSTGQKQLLAFARTIVTNPKILVLDEATANIDTETESMIQTGLDKIREGRTTIAIAHRLSTIKDANNIIVLDKGRIIEAGTHDELLKMKGTYYKMYQLQKKEESI